MAGCWVCGPRASRLAGHCHSERRAPEFGRRGVVLRRPPFAGAEPAGTGVVGADRSGAPRSPLGSLEAAYARHPASFHAGGLSQRSPPRQLQVAKLARPPCGNAAPSHVTLCSSLLLARCAELACAIITPHTRVAKPRPRATGEMSPDLTRGGMMSDRTNTNLPPRASVESAPPTRDRHAR